MLLKIPCVGGSWNGLVMPISSTEATQTVTVPPHGFRTATETRKREVYRRNQLGSYELVDAYEVDCLYRGVRPVRGKEWKPHGPPQ